MAILNKFEFDKVIKKLDTAKVNLPARLSKVAHDFFLDKFTHQNWDGKEWQDVKRREEGTPEYKYPKSKDLARRTRAPLLGKSRNLLKSVNNSQRTATWQEIRLGSDVTYAAYNNEGTATIPQRRFMGHSPELDKQVKAEIKKQLDKVLKG